MRRDQSFFAVAVAILCFAAGDLFAASSGTIEVKTSAACASGSSFRIRYVVSGQTVTTTATTPKTFTGVDKGSSFTIDNIQPAFNGYTYTGSSPVTDTIPNNGKTVTKTLTYNPGTATTVTSSVNPSVYGDSITFTATVSSTATCGNPGTPTGLVMFQDGATIVAIKTLGASGVVTFSTNRLPVGVHPIVTTYIPGGNFAWSASPVLTQTIAPAPLTVSGIAAGNKIYDGATAAALNTGSATLAGVFAGDAVTLNTAAAAGAFADKNAGVGKTVNVSGLSISGASAGNYALIQPAATADITPAAITGSVTARNKFYDGTTDATIASRTLSGALNGDDVDLSCGPAHFCDAEIGSDKEVSATGLGLVGAQAGNYTLASSTATTAASILPAQAPALVISMDADGSARLTAAGSPGVAFSIQAATSLSPADWTTISSDVLDAGGTCTFTDANASQFSCRFYRTVISN